MENRPKASVFRLPGAAHPAHTERIIPQFSQKVHNYFGHNFDTILFSKSCIKDIAPSLLFCYNIGYYQIIWAYYMEQQEAEYE